MSGARRSSSTAFGGLPSAAEVQTTERQTPCSSPQVQTIWPAAFCQSISSRGKLTTIVKDVVRGRLNEAALLPAGRREYINPLQHHHPLPWCPIHCLSSTAGGPPLISLEPATSGGAPS